MESGKTSASRTDNHAMIGYEAESWAMADKLDAVSATTLEMLGLERPRP